MITGFNTNVPHAGRVFHVQTEDSGRAHPHLITHVYFGGTILASEKTSYADRLDAPDLARLVRGLMETQHKRMLARLERGELDPQIAARLDGAAARAETRPEGPPPAARPEPPRGAATQPRLAPSAAPAPPLPSAAPAPAASARRSFGDGVVSEKSLDSLILDYLVDKARGSRRSG